MSAVVTVRPIEWDALHPLDGRPIAIVRLLVLGRDREPYYRADSPEPNRTQRCLLGYWGTLDHAHDGVLARYEHASRRSLSRGDLPPTCSLVPQEAPPGGSTPRHRPGYAARSARHSSRSHCRPRLGCGSWNSCSSQVAQSSAG